MDKGRLATFAFCGVILLVGCLASLPKSLARKFEAAGFHPRLNNSRTLMTRPTDGQPILSEYEYCFDDVPKDRLVAFLQKDGYKVVFQDRPPLSTTRMIKMNSLFKWRVDDTLSLYGTPTDIHFPKQSTLLTRNKKLD